MTENYAPNLTERKQMLGFASVGLEFRILFCSYHEILPNSTAQILPASTILCPQDLKDPYGSNQYKE